ncbi:MAG: LOG family protein [Nanoarchaeota archaeon]|nr:LOG family protein [Nanoarchaeota archaeon]
MKTITISGTSREKEAKSCKRLARELGKLIAERGYILISGGGTGLSKLVVESYHKHGGKKYIAYLPSIKAMRIVGEKIGPKPDKIIRLNCDYPERNLIMIRNSQALIAMHGGLGTLAELVHAAKDYQIPAVVIHFGKLTKYVKAIHEFKGKVFIAKTAKQAIDFIKAKTC